MIKSLAPWIACAAALIVAFSMPSPATAQIDPTHYWTYHLTAPLEQPTTFEARDQFLTEYQPYPALRLERLLNPAWKYHNNQEFPPRDPTAHMTWWDLPDMPYTTTVLVDNQFGENQEIRVEYLDFILLPARKAQTPDLPPPPDNINHYLCYRCTGPSPGVDILLRDQFHEQGQMVASATYLCNPAWKRHQGIEFAPRDTTHLVLYRLEVPNWQAPTHFLRDQFADWASNFIQIPDEYVAVPSVKRHLPTATQQTSWGRIKSIYR